MRRGDEENLLFNDALEMIERLFDSDHSLEKVYQVLKPDGIFVLSSPNLASIHNRISLLFGYQPFPIGVRIRIDIGRIYEQDSDIHSLDHIRVFAHLK